MWRIDEYDNAESQIDTAWLKEEIGQLRISLSPDTSPDVDPTTWSEWRRLVGLAKKDAKGRIKPTRKRTCTQRQAALIVLLALWKPSGRPLVKDVLGSKLNSSQIDPKNIRRLFNEWMEAIERNPDNGVGAQSLLEAIHKVSGRMTGAQLSDLSELMTPGKRVPVGNLARLINEPLRSDRACSRAATETILQWLINRTAKYRNSGETLTINLDQPLLPN